MVLKGVDFTEYDVQFWDSLEKSPEYTAYSCLCKKQLPKGCLPWIMKHYKIQCNGLERSQFLMVSLCSLEMVLKEANFVGMYNGLEMSQLLLYR